MKVAGNEVKSIEILKVKELEEILYKQSFPKKVLEYIKKNKWIPIPNKNLYFNREIMACYPNFLSDKYPKLYYNPISSNVPTAAKALEIIRGYDEYTKYGIEWDMQCANEGKNSFFDQWHPMETHSDYHRIQVEYLFSYKKSDGKMQGYYNYDFGSHSGGVLIPIFRLGRKEDHEAFNTDETDFNYLPETVTLLFILNDLIPDFGNEKINSEYKKLYDEVHEKYGEYIKGVHVNEDKKAVVEFDLDKVEKEIAAGDSEKLFGKNRLKFTFKNGDSVEIDFDGGEIASDGDYTYKNGDIEVCSYKRDENGDFLRTGKSTLTKSNGDVEKLSYKDGVPQGKSEYKFKNGDEEKRTYKDGIFQGKSEYKFKNGDKEKRNYKDGVLQEASEYIYANGERETRSYKDGKLQGDALFYLADGKESKRYRYEDGEKRDITAIYRILNVDKIRVNLDPYDENILADPNRGHWELFEQDASEVEAGLGKKAYGRDPHLDIKQGGIVGIDFGTKSTVVVFQDDNNRTLPMRISGGIMEATAKDSDYENPTVIEFKDITEFMEDYKEKEGRPLTKWKDVTVSHTAFQNLVTGTSEDFYSAISDLKQWAGIKNEKIVIKDKKGVETLFPPYMELEEGEIDPIELYAYYIGSYINNMRNGIYLEYFLSFPVTYEKEIREKILQSFERGIKKSLPVELLKDEEIMKRFKVRHGANEPAAYAVCALQEYEFEPEDDETIYYGVFDFGGGTADFDFGTWKLSEDELRYDYELEHFGAGGDRYLGGENILKELAYEVFKDNKIDLAKNNVSFARPVWCERFVGDEKLVDNSQEAKLNIKMLMEKLRPIWEESEKNESVTPTIKALLYNKKGEILTGVDLDINEDKLKKLIENKIDKGIENFFIAMKKAMNDEPVKKVLVLLAGNSCKHPKVMELFEKHKADMDIEVEIIPALGTEKAYELLEELGIEADTEDETRPTGKTGVAFGILDSIADGRIKVTNRDEEQNLNNEINFKYYVGDERRKKLKVLLSPNVEYETYMLLGYCKSDTFNLFYTSMPEAMNGKMPIAKAERIRQPLKNSYEDKEAKIYIKAVGAGKIAYCVTTEEIENKEFLEEGEIELD